MIETGNLPPPDPVEPPDEVRLIRSVKLTNFLSFGPEDQEIELSGLNVLVGANGSGKSNFLESIALFAASPTDISEALRLSGGIRFLINGNGTERSITFEFNVLSRISEELLNHRITLAEDGSRFKVEYEDIFTSDRSRVRPAKYVCYEYEHGNAVWINHEGDEKTFKGSLSERQSVLAQLKDSEAYPEIDQLQRVYGSIRLYRNWTFGPDSPLRKPQAADLPNDWLAEDYGNLFLILNRLEFEPEAKAEFLDRLRDFLPNVTDYKLQIVGGTIQMFLMEGRQPIPAVRLSDGTLRWLCLLAILVAPVPPSVVVLEEPELGLHPDMINTLADLLKKASKRMQLVVTTHSDILIDALSDVPESVMVVEKGEAGTTVRRLNAEELKPWLEEYRLGRLWMQGQIGGTRW